MSSGKKIPSVVDLSRKVADSYKKDDAAIIIVTDRQMKILDWLLPPGTVIRCYPPPGSDLFKDLNHG